MQSFDPHPEEAEAAAALAAVNLYLAAEQAAMMEPALADSESRSRWHETSRLAQFGLRPQRFPVPPRWSTIERLRRCSGARG